MLRRALSIVALAAALAPATGRGQGPCSAACDKAASTCDDACESGHPDDAKARITCKLACVSQREACEKKCK